MFVSNIGDLSILYFGENFNTTRIFQGETSSEPSAAFLKVPCLPIYHRIIHATNCSEEAHLEMVLFFLPVLRMHTLMHTPLYMHKPLHIHMLQTQLEKLYQWRESCTLNQKH